MDKVELLKKLKGVEALAKKTRWGRLAHHPVKYLHAVLYRKWVYPYRGSKREVSNTFFDREMRLNLPAATDIYLTGGKSHPSEIELAAFLIRRLEAGQVFWDVGAHYGYFSLLAAELVGPDGSVCAFEPSEFSFELLKLNTASIDRVEVFKKAVSNTCGELTFFEFPALYSEYNSLDISQYQNEKWRQKVNAVKNTVQAVTLDSLADELQRLPDVIKIDVEGAEDQVIEGGKKILQENNIAVVMEYLAADRSNQSHRRAKEQLLEWGYRVYRIDPKGELIPEKDPDAYMEKKKSLSENFVFIQDR